jgi:hypothetical protein
MCVDLDKVQLVFFRCTKVGWNQIALWPEMVADSGLPGPDLRVFVVESASQIFEALVLHLYLLLMAYEMIRYSH